MVHFYRFLIVSGLLFGIRLLCSFTTIQAPQPNGRRDSAQPFFSQTSHSFSSTEKYTLETHLCTSGNGYLRICDGKCKTSLEPVTLFGAFNFFAASDEVCAKSLPYPEFAFFGRAAREFYFHHAFW